MCGGFTVDRWRAHADTDSGAARVWPLRGVVTAPAREELARVELGEVGLQRSREAAGLLRRRVPEQHHLAGVDLHDLDVVGLLGRPQQRGSAAAAAHDQLVGAVGLPGGGPSFTSPGAVTIGGVSRTRAAAASASAATSR